MAKNNDKRQYDGRYQQAPKLQPENSQRQDDGRYLSNYEPPPESEFKREYNPLPPKKEKEEEK